MKTVEILHKYIKNKDVKMNKISATKLMTILLFVSFVSLSAQERNEEPVTFNKISEHLYEITGGRGARSGAYIGDNGVLIIDSKMTKQSVDQILNELKKITDKPIRYLVNTHSDGDHVNGNPFFPTSVTIIAHENCRKEFFHETRDGDPSRWNDPEMKQFIPSLTFTENLNIYLGSKKIELWYFGIGHTTGDIVVYFPEELTAFIGDQIFLNRPQLIHSYKGGNSFRHVETLTKMLETLDAQQFCSGHSSMTDHEGIRNHIEKIKGYQKKIKELIHCEKTLEEILKEFKDEEDRIVTTIYNELQEKSEIENK